MSLQILYLAIQRLNVTDGQWNTLITAMQAKGANTDPNPYNRNHDRYSNDQTMWIFHALFDSTGIDEDWFVNWLATQFSIDPANIGTATGYNNYGRFSTISYPDGVTNRIRIGVFGFVSGQGWPSFEASRTACNQYIIDNIAEWE